MKVKIFVTFVQQIVFSFERHQDNNFQLKANRTIRNHHLIGACGRLIQHGCWDSVTLTEISP